MVLARLLRQVRITEDEKDQGDFNEHHGQLLWSEFMWIKVFIMNERSSL